MGKIHPQEACAAEYLRLGKIIFGRTKFIENSFGGQDALDSPISVIGISLYDRSPCLSPKNVVPHFFWGPYPVAPIKSRLMIGKPLCMKHARVEKSLGFWPALLAPLQVPLCRRRGAGNDFRPLEWSFCRFGRFAFHTVNSASHRADPIDGTHRKDRCNSPYP